ncbi:hypothetical protein [Luteibaculum oceani]|uniref:Lipoprotein n=1 Tax=Luteibaculum oceani TaxID=1294296 RepID=A0A5C6V8D8_9FLAO|nr:hypothetical protein [Luteibaculum oceani]TXC81613.1 hypothetical protein FRX97_03575 [Luteibaculum oceani]
MQVQGKYRLILLLFAVFFLACEKEQFQDDIAKTSTNFETAPVPAPINCPAEENADKNADQYSEESSAVYKNKGNTSKIAIDLDFDGKNDLEIQLVSYFLEGRANNETLRITYLNKSWEGVYEVHKEEIKYCNNPKSIKGSVSYKSKQQNFECSGTPGAEIQKKAYLKRLDDLSDRNLPTAGNIQILAQTFTETTDKGRYVKSYHSGPWIQNSGKLLFKNTQGDYAFVALCVPLYTEFVNGINYYHINHFQILNHGLISADKGGI